MPTVDLGIDNSEFNPNPNEYYIDGMLYYGEGKLTDTYFIRNVYLYKNNEFVNTGKHVIYVIAPEVHVGDYITTGVVKGTAMKTQDRTAAFAKVVKGSVKPIDRNSEIILKAYVEFL